MTKSQDVVTRLPYRCAVGARAETGAIARDHLDLYPDKRRPCTDWGGGPPAGETGSGQAGGDEWWLRSGWAQTPVSSFEKGILTGSG
jgi:hypothetical protein